MSENKKNNRSVLLGAAFLMATSAIGPGFLTQTAKFIGDFQASFGFIILASLVLSLIVQVNVWRVICISGMPGQEVANRVLPGLGYVIAFLVALGGFVFNMGNVGGAALGMNTMFGLDLKAAYVVSGVMAIVVFMFKNAKALVDKLTQVLGALMILVVVVMIFWTQPPVGTALKETFLPSSGFSPLLPGILTLLGGTVGGYITFSGAHRLIDAGITGEDNMKQITQSSCMGIGVAAIMRVVLFLAILGVVVKGAVLDPANPAADAFLQGGGQLGYRFFGLVLFAASVTSIIGAAYTSVSFLRTFHKSIADHENQIIIGFIAVSTLVMFLVGQPAKLLVLAGALNGLILPLTLGVCLFASRRKDVMGEKYHHPGWMLVSGCLVVVISAYLGVTSLANLSNLFA